MKKYIAPEADIIRFILTTDILEDSVEDSFTNPENEMGNGGGNSIDDLNWP